MVYKFNSSDLQAHEAQVRECLAHLAFCNYILGRIIGSLDGRTQHNDIQKQKVLVLCSSKQEKTSTQTAAPWDRVTAKWNYRRQLLWRGGKELARFCKSFLNIEYFD